MSDALRHDEIDDRTNGENGTNETPTMFPPLRALPDAAREAALDAVERALAASVRLHRALPPAPMPPAPQLGDEPPERRRREPKPPEDDPAIRRLRARIEPVAMRVPPPDAGASDGALLAWAGGAVGLATLVSLFAVGVLPLPFGNKAEATWSRMFADRASQTQAAAVRDAAEAPAPSAEQSALAERFVAATRPAEAPQPTVMVPQVVKVERVVMPQPAPIAEPAPPPPPAPAARAMDSEEVTALYDRSVVLVEQGDIASARLVLTRAAEAGDARAALARGATYDPEALKKLGVLGVAPDPGQARAWYAKAVDLGSAEAINRLEKLAQATR